MTATPGKLLEERIKKHSTVAAVARDLGITRAHLHAIIKGTGKPGRALASQLAALFDVAAGLWDLPMSSSSDSVDDETGAA